MTTRNEYADKIKARVDFWNAKIAEAEARLSEAEADAKIDGKEALHEMRRMRDEATERLQQVQSTNRDAWADMQKGIESAWSDLETAFDNAVRRFD